MPIKYEDPDCRSGVRDEVKARLSGFKRPHTYHSLMRNTTRICIAAGLALLTLLPDQHLPKAPDSSPKVESVLSPIPPSALSEFRKTFFKEPLDSQLLQYLQTTQGRPPLR